MLSKLPLLLALAMSYEIESLEAEAILAEPFTHPKNFNLKLYYHMMD